MYGLTVRGCCTPLCVSNDGKVRTVLKRTHYIIITLYSIIYTYTHILCVYIILCDVY